MAKQCQLRLAARTPDRLRPLNNAVRPNNSFLKRVDRLWAGLAISAPVPRAASSLRKVYDHVGIISYTDHTVGIIMCVYSGSWLVACALLVYGDRAPRVYCSGGPMWVAATFTGIPGCSMHNNFTTCKLLFLCESLQSALRALCTFRETGLGPIISLTL